jgi:hypothetical protein
LVEGVRDERVQLLRRRERHRDVVAYGAEPHPDVARERVGEQSVGVPPDGVAVLVGDDAFEVVHLGEQAGMERLGERRPRRVERRVVRSREDRADQRDVRLALARRIDRASRHSGLQPRC